MLDPGWTAGSFNSPNPQRGPGAEPPDVVRNLGQSNCVRAQGAAQEAGCVARCLRFEVVASFDEWQSGSARDLNNSALGEPRRRIQAGATAVPPSSNS